MTYNEFTAKHNVKFSVNPVSSRPDGLMSEDMNHYKCRISAGRRGFTLYFSQGFGIQGEPKLSDVLDCLASDASGYENAPDFEDFAAEFGYEPDSRKAEKIYRAIKRQSQQLKRTIGDAAYNELLWNTDRL